VTAVVDKVSHSPFTIYHPPLIRIKLRSAFKEDFAQPGKAFFVLQPGRLRGFYLRKSCAFPYQVPKIRGSYAANPK